jgi:pyridoxal phosphate enzyme (YggS family)
MASRLLGIRERISIACRLADRDPDEIVLVGATKRQPVDLIQEAWNLGLKILGENRVQEAEEKQVVLPSDIDWHLIGPLQSNKAKKAVQLFSTVHSVDRVRIARALDRQAASHNKSLNVFLEVNLGHEASKHGFDPSTLIRDLQPLTDLRSTKVLGLMAIPPFETDPTASRRWFHQLRRLRDDLCNQADWNDCPGFLSMGMSADFEVAIQEGATHVRIGTALFGPRS